MPLAILPLFFFGIVSLALLFGGGFIVYEWWQGVAISTFLLAAGVLMHGKAGAGWYQVGEKERLLQTNHEVHFTCQGGPSDRPIACRKALMSAPPSAAAAWWNTCARSYQWTDQPRASAAAARASRYMTESATVCARLSAIRRLGAARGGLWPQGRPLPQACALPARAAQAIVPSRAGKR